MICPSTLLIHRVFFLVVVAAAAAPIVSAQIPVGWYSGQLGQSCNDVCTNANAALSCTASSVDQQLLVNDRERVQYVGFRFPILYTSTELAEVGATTAPHYREIANPIPYLEYVGSGGSSNCDASGGAIKRICCCLASGASATVAAMACPFRDAPPPTPEPSAKPSMMPSLWKETCPGAFIPVLGLFMKLLCLLLKLITSPFR
jgi:hypothetical protein